MPTDMVKATLTIVLIAFSLLALLQGYPDHALWIVLMGILLNLAWPEHDV